MCTEIKLKSTTIQRIQLLSTEFINGILGVQLKNETSVPGSACIIMNYETGMYNILEQNGISDFLLLTNIYTSTI